MQCKLCNLESDNPEEFHSKVRCVTCHKAKNAAYRRRYYQENKAKVAATSLKWRKANYEHWLAYKRQWEKDNPERVKEYKRKSK